MRPTASIPRRPFLRTQRLGTWARPAVAAALLAGVLGGCTGSLERSGSGPEPDPGAGAAWPGPESHAVRSATGCTLDARLYRPRRARTSSLAVIAPGFLRDQRHMADLAQGLAARGIPAATLTPCNDRPWEGRHFRNGLDMVRFARVLGPRSGARRTLYAGFSAGALAALAAARTDPDAVGVLALDLVDHRGLGLLLAPGLDAPLVGLAGEPGRCNARGNGRTVYRTAPLGRLVAIPGAGHCDFESPTDRLCETLCGSSDRDSDGPRYAVLQTALAAAESLLDLAPARPYSPSTAGNRRENVMEKTP